MSESERRRKYRYNRVMISTERVLDPQFADAVVFLTGAQIEMLRNVTQYLNRLETYVSEQFPGYYLTPTAEEYDSILAIVADMEEELMGNPNTLWGYKDTFRQAEQWPDAAAGTYALTIDAVPAGSVWTMEGFAWKDEDSVVTSVTVNILSEFLRYPLVVVPSPTAGVWHIYEAHDVLKEGDVLEFEWVGVTLNDHLHWQAFGHMMDVP